MIGDFKYHILVVDDDEVIRRLIKKYLVKSGFLVSTAKNAIDAKILTENFNFSLIILDKMMPIQNGTEFIKTIRANKNNTPIIMLTAVDNIKSRIEGLEHGADDYLAKPFDPKELLLRMLNILKRTNTTIDMVKFGGFIYNLQTKILKKENIQIHLTDMEKDLLTILINNKNIALLRKNIAKSLNLETERAVDVMIARLRLKIEPNKKIPEFILTVRNFGYKFII